MFRPISLTSRSNEQYENLRRIVFKYYKIKLPYLKKKSSRLTKLSGFTSTTYECCRESCAAYTGADKDATECKGSSKKVGATHMGCNLPRWKTDKDGNRVRYKPFEYIPLIPRLLAKYRSRQRAHTLQTHPAKTLAIYAENGHNTDWWTSRRLRELRDQEYFKEYTDIALNFMLDGVQVTNRQNHTYNPVLVMNMNLPPTTRHWRENMLLPFVVSGPRKQTNIDSFLVPIIEELKELADGVDAYDNYRGIHFKLRAHVVLVTGDGPAIAEVIGMKTPGNAKVPCRHCMIKATQAPPPSSHSYIPHTTAQAAGNLPLRQNLRLNIEQCTTPHVDPKVAAEFGINRASILLKILTLHFPRSFPIDTMHCILLNIVKNAQWYQWATSTRQKSTAQNSANAALVRASEPSHGVDEDEMMTMPMEIDELISMEVDEVVQPRSGMQQPSNQYLPNPKSLNSWNRTLLRSRQSIPSSLGTIPATLQHVGSFTAVEWPPC
ncbi:hypothetical protein K3495_g13524 [Podosphaera aphanis]|nr:hypothetical protein K3495_g13524 [Podosphaera aphanis]